ncbi:hypothetical protein GPOL_c32280 [Gordonia polyisoprenivorans VH2]|uniref:Uncharacterized protein n=1 Tax=Gordonia polyisoprenivorans (strain DSM 44266 / VH2) TaxID=1112204 RepID=H6MXC4_GORPV|nr:hypothetical protein [Gordonia polyisoprenivorans]AFA74242.1 hypothetical protein GPOL_c32280 [Gordonia polyisoprenivorans VH2]
MSANGYGYQAREFYDRPREFSQADKRERRRRHLTVVLDGGFDLAVEVAEITGPLAEAVAGSPTPHAHRLAVSAVNDAVAEVVFVAVALLAEADAARRTAHIADLSDRRRAMTMLTDRAQRPTAPVVTLDDLTSGEWSAALTEYASQVSDDLAALLGRAVRPGHRRGLDTASERLVDVLRGLDSAAAAVQRGVERAHAAASATASTAPTSDPDAELRRLGVAL